MCPARIGLERCDILSVKADVCISSIHRSRDMKVYPLSKHILKVAGEDVQTELFKRGSEPEELKMGQVEMTGVGGLNIFKAFMFICLRSYKRDNEKILCESLIECLELAAVSGHTSVAIPALGTGGLQYPPDKVAQATLHAVALHNIQYGETTSIKTVKIVLLDEDNELIKTYLRICVSGSTELNGAESADEPVQHLGSDSHQSASAFQPAARSSGSKRGLVQPRPASSNRRTSGFMSVLNSLFKTVGLYQYQIGILQFRVNPCFDGKYLGLRLEAGLDIQLLKSLIPPGLMEFFKSLGNY